MPRHRTTIIATSIAIVGSPRSTPALPLVSSGRSLPTSVESCRLPPAVMGRRSPTPTDSPDRCSTGTYTGLSSTAGPGPVNRARSLARIRKGPAGNRSRQPCRCPHQRGVDPGRRNRRLSAISANYTVRPAYVRREDRPARGSANGRPLKVPRTRWSDTACESGRTRPGLPKVPWRLAGHGGSRFEGPSLCCHFPR